MRCLPRHGRAGPLASALCALARCPRCAFLALLPPGHAAVRPRRQLAHPDVAPAHHTAAVTVRSGHLVRLHDCWQQCLLMRLEACLPRRSRPTVGVTRLDDRTDAGHRLSPSTRSQPYAGMLSQARCACHGRSACCVFSGLSVSPPPVQYSTDRCYLIAASH